MIHLNDMVRAINLLPLKNRYNEQKRPLSEVLVVRVIGLSGRMRSAVIITAKNGAGDTYRGCESDFAPLYKNLIAYHYDDVDIHRANNAHKGTSWTPEHRGFLYADGYASTMAEMDERFSKYETTDNHDALVASLEWFRKKYLEMMWTYLNAHSNCLSSGITGPSNFPTARNEKRNRWAGNHLNAWVEWKDSARKKLERMYNPVKIANAPISSDDDDAPTLLRRKIDDLTKLQEWMKDVNKICQNKKLTDEQKTKKLIAECRADTEKAYRLLHPQARGYSPGFQSYELTNNGAKIRDAKKRLALMEKRRAEETTEEQYGNTRLVDNVEANRVQLFFPDRPSLEVKDFLKKRGWRFAKSARNAWQQYRSRQALADGREAAAKENAA